MGHPVVILDESVPRKKVMAKPMIKMYIGSARWNSKVTIAVCKSPAPATAAASIALRPYRDQ